MKTNLKELRKRAGWSNADDFAASIGMPAKTYRNYEQGTRGLNLDVASSLCNALGCTINDLVPNDPEPENSNEPAIADLISSYKSMSKSGQAALLAIAHDLEEIFPAE